MHQETCGVFVCTGAGAAGTWPPAEKSRTYSLSVGRKSEIKTDNFTRGFCETEWDIVHMVDWVAIFCN